MHSVKFLHVVFHELSVVQLEHDLDQLLLLSLDVLVKVVFELKNGKDGVDGLRVEGVCFDLTLDVLVYFELLFASFHLEIDILADSTQVKLAQKSVVAPVGRHVERIIEDIQVSSLQALLLAHEKLQ